MRTHGWSGQVPRTDADAVTRILDAAQEALDELGREASLADVARRLGVTRQTVYRYFGSTEELVLATADRATVPFAARLVERVRGERDPAAACVELLAYVVEQLPHEPYLRIALALDTPTNRAAAVTSSRALDQGTGVLRALDVPWDELGFDEPALREVMGHLLRLLQSLILDPGDLGSDGVALRAYLRRWLAPAIRALPG